MAKLQRVAGATSNILLLFAQDSSSTTGAGLAGLLYNTSGLTCYYKRNTASVSIAVTLTDITTLGTFVSGGFKAVDGTNMTGAYEFHPPDAAYASGAKSVVFVFQGAANLAPVVIEIELTAVDNQDAAAFGLSRLDAAVSSRLATSGYTAPDNTDIASILASLGSGAGTTLAAIKAKTDTLPTWPTNFASLVISTGGLVAIDGTKTPSLRNQDAVTAPTYDDCMQAAWQEAYGKEPTLNTSQWVKQLPNNSGPARTFAITVDGSGNVIARA